MQKFLYLLNHKTGKYIDICILREGIINEDLDSELIVFSKEDLEFLVNESLNALTTLDESSGPGALTSA